MANEDMVSPHVSADAVGIRRDIRNEPDTGNIATAVTSRPM